MRARRTMSERIPRAVARVRRVDGGPLGTRLLAGALLLLVAAGLVFLAGCEDDECIGCLDTTPPAVPTGVYSVTGDGRIDVYWDYLEYPNRRDLVRYIVYRLEDGVGDFVAIGEVPVEEPYDDFTYRYVDFAVTNGHDYAYAIRSEDAAGNLSEPSLEQVIDTPRPEGYDAILHDVNDLDGVALSGFDFSVLSSVTGRVDPTTPGTTADVYVAFEAGVPFVYTARLQVRLQDYGTFLDGSDVRLDWVSWAPEGGYSLTGRAELIFGHAYIVEILEPGSGELHYAKFAVTGISPAAGTVVLDWAYQSVAGLPELKVPTGPKTVVLDTEPIRF